MTSLPQPWAYPTPIESSPMMSWAAHSLMLAVGGTGVAAVAVLAAGFAEWEPSTWISTILAIVGGVLALLARRDANKAANKSDGAQKTADAAQATAEGNKETIRQMDAKVHLNALATPTAAAQVIPAWYPPPPGHAAPPDPAWMPPTADGPSTHPIQPTP
jgi:hypothetical protein